MGSEDKLPVDINLSAEIARAADLIVNQGHTQDLRATAAHLCGALGLVLFSMSKPGASMNCIPGITEAMRAILLRIEALDAESSFEDGSSQ